MGIWDQIREVVDRGQVPIVKVPMSSYEFYRKPPGRPRKNKPGDRFGSWIMRTPGGSPMKCIWCDKKLKSTVRDIVCSETCRDDTLEWIRVVLGIFSGDDATTYPMEYRGRIQNRSTPFYKWLKKQKKHLVCREMVKAPNRSMPKWRDFVVGLGYPEDVFFDLVRRYNEARRRSGEVDKSRRFRTV